MGAGDERLVKVVMLEALESGSKVRWVKDLQQGLEKFGWSGMKVGAMDGLRERFLLCHYNSKKYKKMEGIQERVKELQRRDFYTLPVLEEVVLPDATGRSQRLETGRCRKTGE